MASRRDNLMASFQRRAGASPVRTQTTGPRAGQSFFVKRGVSGLPIRVYSSGDTALAASAFPGQSGARRQQLARRARSQARSQIATARRMA